MRANRTILTNRASLINQGFFFVLLVGFLQGTSLVLSRFALGQFEATEFVSLRFILASAAHLVFYLFSRSRTVPRDPILWYRSSILGILGTALVIVAVVSALQYLSSGLTSLLLSLSPVMVVLLAQAFLKDEKLTWLKAVGVFIAFVGAGVLLLQGETGLGETVKADWRGYAWAGVSVVAGSATWVYAHRYLRSADGYDVASLRMFSACLSLIPIVLLTGGYDLSRVTWSGFLALAYGGLIGGFAAFLLEFYTLKRFGATASSMTTYVIPVVSTILGVMFLDELVTPLILVSMVLIFVGVWLLGKKKPVP